MVEATLPTLGAVLVTAAVDSINPCAIGVALLLVATLIKQERRRDILKVGMIYVTAVYVTYLLAGFGLLLFLNNISTQVANYVTVFVSLIVIAGGLLEIKDFYWYGQGSSLMIPEEYAEKIADSMDNLTIPAAIILGIFVAAVELPCTGGPYLAILTVIQQTVIEPSQTAAAGSMVMINMFGLSIPLNAILLMLLYNLIFVMPLIIIVVMSYLGSYKVSEMKEWKHMNKARMRMAAGLLMVFLGWILLLLATGIVRFG